MGLVRNEAEPRDDGCELWPENELPLTVFMRLDAGCWIYTPLGEAVGLNWPQVEAILRQLRIGRAEWPAVMAALRVVAAEVIAQAA